MGSEGFLSVTPRTFFLSQETFGFAVADEIRSTEKCRLQLSWFVFVCQLQCVINTGWDNEHLGTGGSNDCYCMVEASSGAPRSSREGRRRRQQRGNPSELCPLPPHDEASRDAMSQVQGLVLGGAEGAPGSGVVLWK